MRFSELFVPCRTNKKNSTKQKKYDYCGCSEEIISGLNVRLMQEKTEWIPFEKSPYSGTQYSHAMEVSMLCRKIVHRVFENESFSDSDMSDCSDISDLLFCASMISSAGKPPFGYAVNTALSEWFDEDFCKLCFAGVPVGDILSTDMKNDLSCYGGVRRALRNALRYSDGDIRSSCPIIKTILHSASDITERKPFLAEKEAVYDMDRSVGVRSRKPPVSYILEASEYIVSVTSAIEEAIYNRCLLCRQVLHFFRNMDDFYEDIEMDEYDSYCRITSSLSDRYIESRLERKNIDDFEAFHNWIVYLRREMGSFVADSFVRNYEKITSGEFEGDLISGSWCRNVKKVFDECEKQIYSAHDVLMSISSSTEILKALVSGFVRAVISYDTDEKMTVKSTRLTELIPSGYRKVYSESSQGKSEPEKLYLRILMALDFIFGTTDKKALELYRTLTP